MTLSKKYKEILNGTYQSLAYDSYLFNEVAGKTASITRGDLKKQLKLIQEELRELSEAVEAEDYVGQLDGCIDVLVTTFGYMQFLSKIGVAVTEACDITGGNNLSKFPLNETEALLTQEKYAKEGIKTFIRQDEATGWYVIVDEEGKVRKPVGFVPNDLSNCVPTQFRS